VERWLDTVLACRLSAGRRPLEVDYGYYAEAEAALGWLNWQADIFLPQPLSPAMVVGPLLDDIQQQLTAQSVGIAHLKMLDQAGTGYIRAGVCSNTEEPAVEGDLAASAAQRHDLVVNLRACGDPGLLRSIVEAAAGKLPGTLEVRHAQSFRPPPPRPEHRIPAPPQP
jgi:hypothetical protein